jgi:hypothetical protein
MTTLTLAVKHPGELTLRRLLAEEALSPSITEHVGGCGECSARLAKLKEEQRAFEAEIPFERFLTGVERSARHQKQAPGKSPVVTVLIALAACLVAFFAGKQVIEEGAGHSNRIKGGASVDFVIDGPSGQRTASSLEPLATGERVRIGVSGHPHVLALSIDESGEVSVVYSETLKGAAQTWLPESIEFTGKGRERVVVLLTEAPLEIEAFSRQLQDRFKNAKGDLTQLGDLEVDGVQVHRTFVKP